MALFSVVLQQGAFSTVDGNNAMIVRATNAAGARAAAQAFSDDDAAPWEQAVATDITTGGDLVLAGYKVGI